MIIHAMMAAACRREGYRRPTARIRALVATRMECPMTPALCHRSSAGRSEVPQLPMTAARPSAMISRTDQANAKTPGSQMVHGRHVPRDQAWGLASTPPSMHLPRPGQPGSEVSVIDRPSPSSVGSGTDLASGNNETVLPRIHVEF